MAEALRQFSALPRNAASGGGESDGAGFREEDLASHRGERSRAAQHGLEARICLSPIMDRRGGDQRLAPSGKRQQGEAFFDLVEDISCVIAEFLRLGCL